MITFWYLKLQNWHDGKRKSTLTVFACSFDVFEFFHFNILPKTFTSRKLSRRGGRNKGTTTVIGSDYSPCVALTYSITSRVLQCPTSQLTGKNKANGTVAHYAGIHCPSWQTNHRFNQLQLVHFTSGKLPLISRPAEGRRLSWSRHMRVSDLPTPIRKSDPARDVRPPSNGTQPFTPHIPNCHELISSDVRTDP